MFKVFPSVHVPPLNIYITAVLRKMLVRLFIIFSIWANWFVDINNCANYTLWDWFKYDVIIWNSLRWPHLISSRKSLHFSMWLSQIFGIKMINEWYIWYQSDLSWFFLYLKLRKSLFKPTQCNFLLLKAIEKENCFITTNFSIRWFSS